LNAVDFQPYNLPDGLDDGILSFLLADTSFCLAQGYDRYQLKNWEVMRPNYHWADNGVEITSAMDVIFWEAFGCHPEEWINVLTHFQTDKVLSDDPFRKWIMESGEMSSVSFASITTELEELSLVDLWGGAGLNFRHISGRLTQTKLYLRRAGLGILYGVSMFL
jgi:hypothetical protein